jgi:hypothetical protein
MLHVFAVGLAFVAGLGGCHSGPATRGPVPSEVRFYLEAAGGDGTPITLPRSGVHLTVNPKPVITEGDIVNVELVKVDLGLCLLFQLTPAGVRDFYRMSVSHQGRRIALVVEGVALGARIIDGPVTNGVIFVFAELPDEELPALVEKLKRSSVAMQREIARKG